MATLSRRLHRLLLSNPKACQFSIPFSTYLSSHESSDSSSDSDSVSDSDKLTVDPIADSPPTDTTQNRMVVDRPLENGLDVGIYKVYSIHTFNISLLLILLVILELSLNAGKLLGRKMNWRFENDFYSGVLFWKPDRGSGKREGIRSKVFISFAVLLLIMLLLVAEKILETKINWKF